MVKNFSRSTNRRHSIHGLKDITMIKTVFVPTVSHLHGNITRAQDRINPGSSSGLVSVYCGAWKEEQYKRAKFSNWVSNGVDSEYEGFERSGRILSRKGWTRTILTAAERSPRLRVCSTASGGGERGGAVAEEMEVMEGDVVEYPLAADPGVRQEGNKNGRRVGVGVIVDLFEDSDVLLCQIEPLCQEDLGSKEWINDELQPEITVPIGQVRVLQAWYSQRMVPDRISNPHGEHAENLWILE